MAESTESSKTEVELREDEEGLALVGDDMVLRADFSEMLPRVQPEMLQRELLIRAARIKDAENPVAIDATAGLGEDSFLLAAAGFTVEMYEHNPVIAALLRDALERAADSPELADIAGRMHLHEEDSVAALERLAQTPGQAPEVVYLDPMFPKRHKTAAVKKKLQLLQQLEKPCTNADAVELINAAVKAKPRKVVIKRPTKGPYLAGIKPAYTIEGKAVRFDCITPASLPAQTSDKE